MSIQKKSLISTLKSTKKANVAAGHDTDAKGSKVSSMVKIGTKTIGTKGLSKRMALSSKYTLKSVVD